MSIDTNTYTSCPSGTSDSLVRKQILDMGEVYRSIEAEKTQQIQDAFKQNLRFNTHIRSLAIGTQIKIKANFTPTRDKLLLLEGM